MRNAKKSIIRMRKESYIHLWKCSYLECRIVFYSYSVSSFCLIPQRLRRFALFVMAMGCAACGCTTHSHHGERQGGGREGGCKAVVERGEAGRGQRGEGQGCGRRGRGW